MAPQIPCSRPVYELTLSFRNKEELREFERQMESPDGAVLREKVDADAR